MTGDGEPKFSCKALTAELCSPTCIGALLCICLQSLTACACACRLRLRRGSKDAATSSRIHILIGCRRPFSASPLSSAPRPYPQPLALVLSSPQQFSTLAMKSPDGQFALEVLVAGEPQREYVHGNRTYVVRVQRPAPPPASLSLLSPASATMSVRRRADDGAPPPTPRAQESRLDTPATKMVDLVRPAPSPAPTRAWPCG